LNNSWKKEIKDSAKQALQMLTDLPKHERVNKSHIDDILNIISSNLNEDFSSLIRTDTKSFIKRNLLLGLNDSQKQVPHNTKIGMYGIRENKLETLITKQNLFWIGNRYGTDIEEKFKNTLKESISSGYTKKMLANKLKEEFKSLGDKSQHYWQGLAEHTALRIREFGRLEGYHKAGAKGYRLVVILDDRTSEICKALSAQDKVYPVDTAIDTMNKLLSINTNKHSLDKVREMTKQIAPWVSDKQIKRDSIGQPIGVSGNYSPFPPFHWRCRTTTEMTI
jgi:hypothetical protein